MLLHCFPWTTTLNVEAKHNYSGCVGVCFSKMGTGSHWLVWLEEIVMSVTWETSCTVDCTVHMCHCTALYSTDTSLVTMLGPIIHVIMLIFFSPACLMSGLVHGPIAQSGPRLPHSLILHQLWIKPITLPETSCGGEFYTNIRTIHAN